MNNRTTETDNLENLAGIFQTIGDANRMRILCRIFAAKNACVSDIAENLDLSVAVTSYHLKALADRGLLEPKRDGKRVCYAPAKTTMFSDIKKLICKYK